MRAHRLLIARLRLCPPQLLLVLVLHDALPTARADCARSAAVVLAQMHFFLSNLASNLINCLLRTETRHTHSQNTFTARANYDIDVC